MMDNSEVLEISKENIQPLRHGRKAAQLKTALQAQVDPDVHQQLIKEREKYEYLIRMYEGEDPLEPYYSYIQWLEQSFPSMSRENNMFLLLEDTLLRFKDCDKYRQDPRLVQLLIKYISFQCNALELYQLVYNQGLGTMCSSLYKAWAEELEKLNDFKRADQVFQLGLQCKAQPANELQDAHVQFQLSIARKLLEGNINSTSTATSSEQSRNVLSKLQPSKVKSSRVSKDVPGVLTSTATKSQDRKTSNFGNGKFQVYQEDDDADHLKTRYKNETERLPKGSTANHENVMTASKWHGQKVKQKSSQTSSTSSIPTFDIHEDPEAAYDNVKMVIRPCALKTRKEEFRCPVAIFGSPNPNQQPMYPKQLVYVGGRDVQLEEIRAAFYWKKVEKQKQNAPPKSNPNMDKSYSSDSQSSSNSESSQETVISYLPHKNPLTLEEDRREIHSHRVIKTAPANDQYCNDNKTAKSERYTKLFQLNDKSSDMLITPARPVASIEVYVDENISSTSDKRHKTDNFNAMKSSSSSSTVSKSIFSIDNIDNAIFKVKLGENEPSTSKQSTCFLDNDFKFLKPSTPPSKTKTIGNINVFVDGNCLQSRNYDEKQTGEFDFMDSYGRTDGFYSEKSEGALSFENRERDKMNFNHSLSSSMTVHTKAAMNVIQEMWESPLTHEDAQETKVNQPVVKSSKYRFSVFGEEPQSPKKEPASSNKVAFSVFCDEETFLQENDDSSKRNNNVCAIPSELKSEVASSSDAFKKNAETERKFGTPLPLIVPVKLQDSPVQPENKENRFPAEYSPPDEDKNSEDRSDDEELFESGKNCDIDDETCNTRVFAISLPSSTPRSQGDRQRGSRKYVYDDSYFSNQDNDFSICCTKPAPKMITAHNTSEYFKKSNKTASDLSLILENSKEQGSGSSSSSGGNTGSRILFS